jgi:hypothetical protein
MRAKFGSAGRTPIIVARPMRRPPRRILGRSKPQRSHRRENGNRVDVVEHALFDVGEAPPRTAASPRRARRW